MTRIAGLWVLVSARPEAGSSDGFQPEQKPYSALGFLRTQNIPRCHRPASASSSGEEVLREPIPDLIALAN
jgi:hypothetical protein